MKCHYEVLNLPREATAAEIKTAYRRLALQWHPDKNPDKPVEAKEQFQLVQNAYEVLSDLQERAWYDSHREQLLRGAGSSYNDDSLDVFPYFSPSCYKGFGDDPQGFYSVYAEVFSKLAAEETDYLNDPEDLSKIPKFGNSTTAYEDVHEFYAYWMSFSTSKSYVWLDQHEIQQGDNRRLIKMMEKENTKIRQKARKERNEEIRSLVRCVRRRDKRVKEQAKLLAEKAEDNKKKDSDFDFDSKFITVDLRHNRIETVRLEEKSGGTGAVRQPSMARVLLDDNPLRCDCRLHELARRLQHAPATAPDPGSPACATPPALARRPLRAVPLREFTCELPAPACPAACLCDLHAQKGELRLTCDAVPAPAAWPALPYRLLDGLPVPDATYYYSLRLTRAPADEPLSLPARVRTLNMSRLGLRAVPRVSPPPDLLDLRGNELRVAAPRDNTTRLLLAGNELACDCDHADDVVALQLRNNQAEQLRRERIIQRQKEIQEAQECAGESSFLQTEDYQQKLSEIESLLAEEFGISSEDDTISEGGMESSNEESSNKTEASEASKNTSKSAQKKPAMKNLYCSACNKLFKNVKSFENHENSKKHKENVANMTLDDDIAISDKDTKDEDEIDAPETGDKSLDSNGLLDEEKENRGNSTSDIDVEDVRESLSDDSDKVQALPKSQKKKKNKKKTFVPMPESEGNDSHDEMSFNEIEGPARSRKSKKLNMLKNQIQAKKEASLKKGSQSQTSTENLHEVSSTTPTDEVLAEALPEDTNKPSLPKVQRNVKAKKPDRKPLRTKTSEIEDIDVISSCAVCNTQFPSKNKLFDHLKKTGHSIPLPQTSSSNRKGKKGNR